MIISVAGIRLLDSRLGTPSPLQTPSLWIIALTLFSSPHTTNARGQTCLSNMFVKYLRSEIGRHGLSIETNTLVPLQFVNKPFSSDTCSKVAWVSIIMTQNAYFVFNLSFLNISISRYCRFVHDRKAFSPISYYNTFDVADVFCRLKRRQLQSPIFSQRCGTHARARLGSNLRHSPLWLRCIWGGCSVSTLLLHSRRNTNLRVSLSSLSRLDGESLQRCDISVGLGSDSEFLARSIGNRVVRFEIASLPLCANIFR